MIYYFEDNTWIETEELTFICKKGDDNSGYDFYKTRKGGYVKSMYGLFTSENTPPKYEKVNKHDLDFIKKHDNPNPDYEI